MVNIEMASSVSTPLCAYWRSGNVTATMIAGTTPMKQIVKRLYSHVVISKITLLLAHTKF